MKLHRFYFKVLTADGRGSYNRSFRYSMPVGNKPGKWHHLHGVPVLCNHGFHVTERPKFWSRLYGAPLITIAEVRGRHSKVSSSCLGDACCTERNPCKWCKKHAKKKIAFLSIRIVKVINGSRTDASLSRTLSRYRRLHE